MMHINTKKVDSRRAVKYATLDELASEADRIARAEVSGRVQPLGNWSPGQNLQHLARFMTCSLDGFEGKLPIGFRLFGRILRIIFGRRLFQNPPPPGYTLPATASFGPDGEVSAADGAAELCAVIERIRNGAEFIPESPFLGPLTREQWIELHLRHAELHLSFVGLED